MELGLYESVITHELERRLAALVGREADVTAVDPADQTLSSPATWQRLFKGDWRPTAIQRKRLALANQVLALIEGSEPIVEDPLKQLRGVINHAAPGRSQSLRRNAPRLLSTTLPS